MYNMLLQRSAGTVEHWWSHCAAETHTGSNTQRNYCSIRDANVFRLWKQTSLRCVPHCKSRIIAVTPVAEGKYVASVWAIKQKSSSIITKLRSECWRPAGRESLPLVILDQRFPQWQFTMPRSLCHYLVHLPYNPFCKSASELWLLGLKIPAPLTMYCDASFCQLPDPCEPTFLAHLHQSPFLSPWAMSY